MSWNNLSYELRLRTIDKINNLCHEEGTDLRLANALRLAAKELEADSNIAAEDKEIVEKFLNGIELEKSASTTKAEKKSRVYAILCIMIPTGVFIGANLLDNRVFGSAFISLLLTIFAIIFFG